MPGQDPAERATQTAATLEEKPKSGFIDRLKSKGKRPSLFEKVTGSHRGEGEPGTVDAIAGRKASVDPHPLFGAKPSMVAGSGSTRGTESLVTSTAEKPVLAAPPEDRPHASDAEDDLLDIPAFLRRQAN